MKTTAPTDEANLQKNGAWHCLLGAAVLAICLVAPSRSEAYPLNLWGDSTPPGQISILPVLYVYNSPGALYGYFYGAAGITDKIDIIAGAPVAFNLNPVAFTWDYFDLIPRYFLMPGLAIAAHLSWKPGADILVGPEVHFAKSWEHWALTGNFGYQPDYKFSDKQWGPGAVYALIAPEYNFSKRFSVFLELDPTVLIQKGYTLDRKPRLDATLDFITVPGVSFALDDNQTNCFAVGVQIDLPGQGPGIVSLGLWYSTSFAVGPQPAAAPEAPAPAAPDPAAAPANTK